MATAPFVTKEIMTKAWTLNAAGVEPALIAETLDISANTVGRIIGAVNGVLSGVNEEELYRKYPANQVRNALELFGERNKETDDPKEEDADRVQDYKVETLNILREMQKAIEKQNELLEKFCGAFGVN